LFERQVVTTTLAVSAGVPSKDAVRSVPAPLRRPPWRQGMPVLS
jgi:hypothetical protein